jgi:hypothetical protein
MGRQYDPYTMGGILDEPAAGTDAWLFLLLTYAISVPISYWFHRHETYKDRDHHIMVWVLAGGIMPFVAAAFVLSGIIQYL